eukprot:13590147-Ditylum_brightwellii.AAC.1
MKEYHSVEVAKFSKARGIADEPSFQWWVPYTLHNCDVILAQIKACICKTNHKYSIEIPTSVAHAMEIDKRNGNTMWQNALDKEMTNISIAFELLISGQSALIGWSKATGHLIWDMKIDFTRKSC